MSLPAFSPTAGTVLAGKYRVERLLGKGGMGYVVAAHHELLDQRVAVKLMLPEAAADPSAVERFLREARAAARLESDHVARIFDVGRLDSGAPYIAMEFLEGDDLETFVERHGPMAVTAAVDCIPQAIDAIGEAHSLGIVHRDLKPANLFRVHKKDGTAAVKVLDFGIARNFADVKLTAPTALVGSPSYMSPEQVRADRVIDTRADIWALGITLYELVTARMPFAGEAPSAVFVAIVEGRFRPMRSIRPDIPPELEAVVAKCLRTDREERFRDVVELAAALVPLGGGTGVRAAERSAALFRLALEDAPTAPSDESSLASGGSISDTSRAASHPSASGDPNGWRPNAGRDPKKWKGLAAAFALTAIGACALLGWRSSTGATPAPETRVLDAAPTGAAVAAASAIVDAAAAPIASSPPPLLSASSAKVPAARDGRKPSPIMPTSPKTPASAGPSNANDANLGSRH